jgi:hypothetical protein
LEQPSSVASPLCRLRHAAPLSILVLVAAAGPARGQPAKPPVPTTNVEVDPIRCWWRTSAGAVRTGETFSVVLTCAVLDNEAVEVVPDESRLGVAAAQMAPFEIVGGSHPPDLRAGQRRFFQYEYTLRALSPDLIGRDVPLPETQVQYRINTRVAGNTAQTGRDLVYMLPPQSVRVESMVPEDASDIRDTTDQSFGRIEALTSQAGVLNVVAVTLIALGSLTTLLAVVGAIRRTRPARAAGERPLGPHAVAALAARELAAVQRATADQGWSERLADRAIAATRVAAACALDRTVAERTADPDAEPGDGQVLVTRRAGRRRVTRGVSSPVTAAELARAADRLPAAASPARRQAIEELRDTLAALTEARYGRTSELDRTALDRALERALARARQLRAERRWPKPALRRWTTRTRLLESRT